MVPRSSLGSLGGDDMAKKVRCPACGAKNAADLPRCRLCGAMIQTDEAVGLRVEVEARAEAGEEPLIELREMPDSGGGIDYDPQPARASQEFLTIDPDAHYETDQVERPWTLDAPPPPTRDDPLDPDFDHFELEEIDVDMHIYEKPPGIPVLSDEQFDPDGLVVEKKETPPPLIVEPDPNFDLDGLEVGVPRDPRPSS